MAKQLPKKLFVKVDGAKDEEYFVADADMYTLAVGGEKIKIGTYQLVETIFAEYVVKTSAPLKR